MSNTSNFFPNSQHSSIPSEQKNIIDSLYRCSEPELHLILYAKTMETGIDSTDVKRYLRYSDSASSSILRRLTDNTINERLISPLLKRKKCGARGGWLYFINEEVELEEIQKVIQERGYSYERFIDNQSRKISKKDSANYQKQSEQGSTNAPNTSTQIDSQGEENPQEEKAESTVSDFDSVKTQETNLPHSSESSEKQFPFMFGILKEKLAEKDKELQELRKEYEKVLSELWRQEAR